MVEKKYFGENRNIEYKREIPKRHEKFLKDVIAFSNSSGGKIIIGIEDMTNAVYGIGDRNPFRMSDDISNMISDACVPQIDPEITMQTVEGKTVLIIDVIPGKYRPYYIKSIGKEASTYIRINGTSRLADDRKLQELELEGQKISYDSIQEIGQCYDENKAWELCKTMKQIAVSSCETEDEKAEIQDMTIEKLEDMGILCKVGREFAPTHAFSLLTDNPVKYAKVQCAVFKGTVRDIFIDKKEFRGPVFEQIESAYQFVLRHINLGAEINGVYRNDKYELPLKAVREMIANAVVHRSYLDDSCIQVSVYDDRIEVSSPGGLYGGLDMETVKQGKSKCRNAVIAEAFYYMHIIESWGTGLPRIVNQCRDFGLREPIFEELGDNFKVTLFRKVINEEQKVVNDDEKVINEEQKVVNDDEKVINEEQKVVNEEQKVINEEQKVVNEEQKVINEVQKVVNAFTIYERELEKAGITKKYIANIREVFEYFNEEEGVFGQSEIMRWLDCSKTKAANIIKKMKEAGIIEKVKGFGAGKYVFRELT